MSAPREARRGWPEPFEGAETADRALDPDLDDVVLVWGNPGWYPRAFASLRRLPAATRPFVAVWQSEPLPPPRASGLPRPGLHARELAKIALRDARATDPYTNLRLLRRLAGRGLVDLLAVSSHGAAETLAEHGVGAEVVPLGYDDRHGRLTGRRRDADIVFLGALEVPRRRRALRRLQRAGFDVHALGSWSDPRYWGEERVALLNRAKILLNVSRHAGQFSGERLLLGAANGALVVSEPMYRPAPFVPGEHYVEADLERLDEALSRYLGDERARSRIADRAHAFVTSDLTLDASLGRILGLVAARRHSRGG